VAGQSSSSSNPYASIGLSWKVGPKTSMDFNYSHSAQQTDVTQAVSSESDAVSVAGKYQINNKISLNAAVKYSINNYNNSNTLAFKGVAANVSDENILSTDFSITYKINNYFSVDLSHGFTNLDSKDAGRSYSRNQVGFGIRAEY
jgi:hypothetical protein